MKQILLLLAAVLLMREARAQITITGNDMPVNGDTLRWSAANTIGANLNLSNTGANISWDYSSLVAIAQGLDHYQTAAQVNPAYALTISPTAYGYKVADSIPGLGGALPIPVSINNIYSFFNKKSNPSRYVAEGFAASLSGLPTPAAYSDEDEIYYLPLSYGQRDSSGFRLNVSIPTLGAYMQQGYRITKVDGWGRIKTPYFTTDTPALRIRSEIVEVDSVTITTIKIGIPRTTIEYKWLVNGQHYPALIVTATKAGTTETPTTVRYRDINRHLGVDDVFGKNAVAINVWPNPVTGILHLELPASLKQFSVNISDATGTIIYSGKDQRNIDVSGWAHGLYFIRIAGKDWKGYAKVMR